MADANSNNNFPTVLGADVVFKGEMRSQKGVRLLGRFEGDVRSEAELVVGEGAVLAGNVQADNVRVEGHVKGNLEAKQKVSLSASAKVEGDLQTARLEVAEGAMLVGQCMIGVTEKGRTEGRAAGTAHDGRSKTQPAVEPVAAAAKK